MNRTLGQGTVSTPGREVVASAIALSVPPRVRLRVSPAGFRKLCRANPDLRLERSTLGDLEVMSPASVESGRRNARLTTRLGVWSEADGTGEHFDSSTGFTLPNGATRSPDASWVLKDRWMALTPEQQGSFAPLCPDFVAELRSPSDDKSKLRNKMAEYIAQGARLGWLLDPLDETVEIYQPDPPVETLQKPSTLSGENVLPVLTLDLKGILFV
ncbi:Uma2 family endonuclease [soil metagenome]